MKDINMAFALWFEIDQAISRSTSRAVETETWYSVARPIHENSDWPILRFKEREQISRRLNERK